MNQLQEPYGTYERLLEQGPVHWSDDLGVWLVLGYDECRRVQIDEEIFAHPNRRDLVPTQTGYDDLVSVLGGERSLILLQDEPHRLLHRAVIRTLAQEMPGYVEREIRPLLSLALDELAGRDRVELVGDFCEHLPTAVIAGILGLPWRTDPELLVTTKLWNNMISRTRESFDVEADAIAAGREAGEQLTALIAPVVRERASRPQSDFISALWRIGPEIFEDWSEDDVVAQCRLLFFAGSNSTTHFLSNLGYVFFGDQDLQARLREDPALVPRFAEEVLRVFAAVQFKHRIAVADVELAGAQIRAGDRVYAMGGAANRDPNRYETPHDVALDASGSRGHLAFNAGPRTCPGAPLARVEGQEVLRALLRFREARLDPDAEQAVFDGGRLGGMMTSFKPLHVILRT